MSKKNPYDLAIFIGRFQPLHNGHVKVMNHALLLAKNVLVLVGSVNGVRTFKNPFTFEQRAQVINDSVSDHSIQKMKGQTFSVRPLKDSQYNNEDWIESVQKQVSLFAQECQVDLLKNKIVLVGHQKDESSQYLTWFPHWAQEPAPVDDGARVVDATSIRNILFEGLNEGFLTGVVPPSSFQFLNHFQKTETYFSIKEEYDFIKKEQKEAGAINRIATYSASVVVCSGYVLLIKRANLPGKGLWAIPSGNVASSETILQCATRSLFARTSLLMGHKMALTSKVFDSPGRSIRERAMMYAFLFNISTQDGKLPEIHNPELNNQDEVAWVALGDLDENTVFEDNFAIIKNLTRSTP